VRSLAEVDRQDVVFNGHYFYTSTSPSRNTGARSGSLPGRYRREIRTDIYAVKASAEYHGSASYDQLIDIGLPRRPHRPLSMQLVFGIWRGGRAHHERRAHLRQRRSENEEIGPWPETIRQAILGFERTRPPRRTREPKQFKYCFETSGRHVIESPPYSHARTHPRVRARRYDPQPMHSTKKPRSARSTED